METLALAALLILDSERNPKEKTERIAPSFRVGVINGVDVDVESGIFLFFFSLIVL